MSRTRGRAGSVPASVLALLSGAALIVFSLLGLHHDRAAPSEFGAIPDASVSSGVASAQAAASTSARPASADRTTKSNTKFSAKPSKPSTKATAKPSAEPSRVSLTPLVQRIIVPSKAGTTLTLPSLGITAPVETVTVDQGALQVPENPSHVGWWSGSALPGSGSGTVIIDGHVDSASYGRGALFGLSELGSGDRVTLRSPGSTPVEYQVVARQVYVKSQGLPDDLWTSGGSSRLALISCGGPFDKKTLSYQDNVVVFAVPVQHG
jgi:hypothetical protein